MVSRTSVASPGSSALSTISPSTSMMITVMLSTPPAALAALTSVNNGAENIPRALAEYSLGHAAESQRSLDFLLTHNAYVWGYQIAEIYAWRGEKDKAFEWLERSYRHHDAGLTYLSYDRWLASLRGDPRFNVLLQKLKLPN